MIQFNLEKYLKTPKRKVITRDGRSVRIICTDRMDNDYPIIALTYKESDERVECYTKNGEYFKDEIHDQDLFFVSEKKEGWINLLRSSCGEVFIVTNHPYKDEKTAKREVSDRSNVVATCKITWEE